MAGGTGEAFLLTVFTNRSHKSRERFGPFGVSGRHRERLASRLPASALTRPLRAIPSLASRPWAWVSTVLRRMPDRFRPRLWQTRMRRNVHNSPASEPPDRRLPQRSACRLHRALPVIDAPKARDGSERL